MLTKEGGTGRPTSRLSGIYVLEVELVFDAREGDARMPTLGAQAKRKEASSPPLSHA